MYDKNSTADKVDEVRLDLFARKQRSYNAISPTSASLIQHVKRSVFQAACIQGQATVCKMQIESPANWGWQKDGEVWKVLWSKLPAIAESCQQLTKCGCKTDCRGDANAIASASSVHSYVPANVKAKKTNPTYASTVEFVYLPKH